MASRRSRERKNASLPADIARCAGVGSDAEGWREGCEDCLRRTCAPTDHPWVAYMDPPKVIEFFCPYHMQPERCHNTGDMFDEDDDDLAKTA